MSRRLTRSDLVDAALLWLLRIDWDGESYYFSSYPVDVTDADGNVYQYTGGLGELILDEQIGLMSVSPELQTVAVEVVFPIDVALRISQGHDLSEATGELAKWREGDAYEDRQVKIIGSVVEPEYGTDGEPVTFSLEENPYDDTNVVPKASQSVSEATWPSTSYTVPEKSIGLYYPEPFGQPGIYVSEAGASSTGRGSPTVIVDTTAANTDRVVIANGRVQATTVTIVDEDAATEVFAVTLGTDGLGQAVSSVDLTGAAVINRTQDLWVAWHSGPAMLGVTGAGSLLRKMLLRSSLRLDLGRIEAVVPYLDRFDVGGYYDAAIVPFEWLQDNLIPLLPIEVVTGPDGLWPLLWPHSPRREDAIFTIEDGVNATRVSQVTYDRGRKEVVNELRAEYAIDGTAGALRTLTHGPKAISGDVSQTTSRHSQLSAARPHGTVSRSFETDIVWTDRTMRAILSWQIIAQAFPTRIATYELGAEADWLELGAQVIVIDAGVHLDTVAVIMDKEHTDTGLQAYTVLVYEDIEDKQ